MAAGLAASVLQLQLDYFLPRAEGSELFGEEKGERERHHHQRSIETFALGLGRGGGVVDVRFFATWIVKYLVDRQPATILRKPCARWFSNDKVELSRKGFIWLLHLEL